MNQEPTPANVRLTGTDTERDAFEAAVEQWTGRKMEYHHQYGTTGLEFAWFCWQAGRDRGALPTVWPNV